MFCICSAPCIAEIWARLGAAVKGTSHKWQWIVLTELHSRHVRSRNNRRLWRADNDDVWLCLLNKRTILIHCILYREGCTFCTWYTIEMCHNMLGLYLNWLQERSYGTSFTRIFSWLFILSIVITGFFYSIWNKVALVSCFFLMLKLPSLKRLTQFELFEKFTCAN